MVVCGVVVVVVGAAAASAGEMGGSGTFAF